MGNIHVKLYEIKYGSVVQEVMFKEKVYGRRADALTVGYLLGSYSVRKSSQESISTQQIPDIFYGIHLILCKLAPLICK